jgi:hypothetical protein
LKIGNIANNGIGSLADPFSDGTRMCGFGGKAKVRVNNSGSSQLLRPNRAKTTIIFPFAL